VFKLYYQGWILFSLASAFAVWSILAGRRDNPGGESPSILRQLASLAGRGAFGLVVIALFAAGMTYPVLAASGRALVDTKRLCDDAAMSAQGRTCPALSPLTLDGVPTMVSQDEYAAIQCLAALVPDRDAVLVEAPCNCGYHPEIGRFSGLTGIPTLLGWGNHEGQWRGDTYPEVTDARYEDGQFRDRIIDARELYTTQDWSRAWAVIDRYGIDYIVVGGAERQMIADLAGQDAGRLREYNLGLQKFEQVFEPVCAIGSAAVYRVAPD
ncbi:MAG: hypothetical protein JW910_02875, partial [Anaerolineae bacterium]|nr:hypothetical protein [Anaerolineae bacterium]